MPNPNPFQARKALQEQRQAALHTDLDTAREALKLAILRNRTLLDSQNPEQITRASHALAQVASSLLRICESIELESRVAALEESFSYGSTQRAITPLNHTR